MCQPVPLSMASERRVSHKLGQWFAATARPSVRRGYVHGGVASGIALSQTIIYSDEAAFLAAADVVAMESFEGLALGTVSGSFTLPGFTVTADQSIQVLGSTISPYSRHHGEQALINYDFSRGIGLSTEFQFTLQQPTHAFGVWVRDWGTLGPDGSEWVWTTNAGDSVVVATRPQLECDDTGSPDACWRFIGVVNKTATFTEVRMSDPDGDGDGYLFDQAYTGTRSRRN